MPVWRVVSRRFVLSCCTRRDYFPSSPPNPPPAFRTESTIFSCRTSREMVVGTRARLLPARTDRGLGKEKVDKNVPYNLRVSILTASHSRLFVRHHSPMRALAPSFLRRSWTSAMIAICVFLERTGEDMDYRGVGGKDRWLSRGHPCNNQ